MSDDMADNTNIEPAVARLAEEIRRRRKAANLSHAQLAAMISYTRPYLSMAESPLKGLPSANLVAAIDHALHADGTLIAMRQKAATARHERRRHRSRAGRTLSPATALVTAAGVSGRGLDAGQEADGIVAVQTPPGRFFAGTSIAAKTYPASDDGRVVATVPAGFVDDPLLRRRQRGLVVGVVDGEYGRRLFGLDTRLARQLVAGAPDAGRLLMSRAYELDDLTLGLLWAVANFDEALLDDDATLSANTRQLRLYEKLPRSTVGREIATDLAPPSRMWLGSQFCASHIARHTDLLTEVPAFWTREQRGEEASTWLLFAHKYTYLRQSGGANPNHDNAPTRAFCVPPSTVAESSRSERILLLLAVALMESFGIVVDICAEPEYSATPGFVFDGNRHAIVANWVGTDGIWQVDVTDASPALRAFADATGYARAHSVTAAGSPGRRLQALASFLDLDWVWLVRRCRELGKYGAAGIAEPRSRLLSTEGVDRACRFVAVAG